MNIGSKQRISLAIDVANTPTDARGSIALLLTSPSIAPPDIAPPDIAPPDILTAAPPDITPTPFFVFKIERGFVHDATGFYHFDFAIPNDVRAVGEWTLTFDLPGELAGHLQTSLTFQVAPLRSI